MRWNFFFKEPNKNSKVEKYNTWNENLLEGYNNRLEAEEKKNTQTWKAQ
jgi:hypothetical protein